MLSSPSGSRMSLLKRVADLIVAQQRRTYLRVVSGDQPMPTRRNVLATINLIQLGGGVLVSFYLWMWCRDAKVDGYPLGHVLLIQALMLASSLTWSARLTAPMGRVERALAAGLRPDQLPPEDLRLTLLQHQPLTRAMLVQWLLGGTAMGLLLGPQLDHFATSTTFGMVTTLLFSAIMPVLVRYELLIRIGFPLTSHLLPAGRLDPLGEIAKGKVYHHIWLLLGLLGVVLPLSVFLLTRDPTVSNLLQGLLIVDLVTVGLYVGSRTLRAISLPVGYLETQMELVRSGRLDLQARLFNIDTFGTLISDFNAMIEGLRQRERIRDTFGRYVTRQVAEEILSGRLDGGGQRRTATVLFADIWGFTTLAETMPPEEVVSLLNRYLGTMVRCVLDEGGVLDKFIGDAIMALFGVPLSAGSTKADALAALRTAQRMSAALDLLNEERVAAGLAPVNLGIGLHTGELIAGNIGIPERVEYTVIGDTVNLCSRLEGLTRTLGHRVLISQETAELLADEVRLERVDTVTVRGRHQPVTVYTLAA